MTGEYRRIVIQCARGVWQGFTRQGRKTINRNADDNPASITRGTEGVGGMFNDLDNLPGVVRLRMRIK